MEGQRYEKTARNARGHLFRLQGFLDSTKNGVAAANAAVTLSHVVQEMGIHFIGDGVFEPTRASFYGLIAYRAVCHFTDGMGTIVAPEELDDDAWTIPEHISGKEAVASDEPIC